MTRSGTSSGRGSFPHKVAWPSIAVLILGVGIAWWALAGGSNEAGEPAVANGNELVQGEDGAEAGGGSGGSIEPGGGDSGTAGNGGTGDNGGNVNNGGTVNNGGAEPQGGGASSGDGAGGTADPDAPVSSDGGGTSSSAPGSGASGGSGGGQTSPSDGGSTDGGNAGSPAGNGGGQSGGSPGTGNGSTGSTGGGNSGSSGGAGAAKPTLAELNSKVEGRLSQLQSACQADSQALQKEIIAEIGKSEEPAVDVLQNKFLSRIEQAEGSCDQQFAAIVEQARSDYKAAGQVAPEAEWEQQYTSAKSSASMAAMGAIIEAMSN